MSAIKDELDKFVEKAKQDRDEIKLKIHLAKADARQEWEKVEAKWDNLVLKVDQMKDETEAVSKEVLETSQKLADDIKEGFKNIKDKI